MPSMDMVRRFAGVPPETDEQVLSLCLNAAVQWYERAKVPPRENDDLYDFWGVQPGRMDVRQPRGRRCRSKCAAVHRPQRASAAAQEIGGDGRHMKAGDLKHQITIERPKYSTDKSGNRRTKWLPVITCMAKITDVSGRASSPHRLTRRRML